MLHPISHLYTSCVANEYNIHIYGYIISVNRVPLYPGDLYSCVFGVWIVHMSYVVE